MGAFSLIVVINLLNRKMATKPNITIDQTSSITSLQTSTIAHLTDTYISPSDSDFSDEELTSSKQIYKTSGPELYKNYRIVKGYVGPVTSVDAYGLKPKIRQIINIDAPSLSPNNAEIEHDDHPNYTISKPLDLANKLNQEDQYIVSIGIPLDFLKEKTDENIKLCVSFAEKWIKRNKSSNLEEIVFCTY